MSGQPFELRPYQAEAIRAVISAYRDGTSSALITLPTGAGKTVIFSEIARRIMPRRTLIIAHREELLAQAASKIGAVAGIVPGMEKGRMRSAPGDVVVTASVLCSTAHNPQRNIVGPNPGPRAQNTRRSLRALRHR